MTANSKAAETIEATTLMAAPSTRSSRLQRAMEEVMKVQQGPELLCKITNAEFRDAFQAIAVQQRGYMFSETSELAAIPTVMMNFDPDHPEDRSKQVYECKIGGAVLTAETAKALKTAAAERGMRFVNKGEFTNDPWLKANLMTIYSRELGPLVGLVNDTLVEPIRPDAKVAYQDIFATAQAIVGKVVK